ncbi:MAG: carboxypeptidase-like regulatory domain-containing protein [Bacteroidales bacterium]
MKRYFLSFIVLLLFTAESSIFGQNINGVVCDEYSKPISFVSIYLKSNPYIGTSTGENGTYSLETDFTKLNKNDVLIFSFIGYKTVEKSIKEINPNEQLLIKLVDQPIMLDGTAITAKVSRKSSKNAKLLLIEKFKKQLYKDFPDVNRDYRIVSSINVTQDNNVLISNEIIGKVIERPKMGRNGRDSLKIIKEAVKADYTNNKITQGLKKFAEQKIEEQKLIEESKQDKKLADSNSKNKKFKKPINNNAEIIAIANNKGEFDKKVLQVHKLLWGDNIKARVKNLDFNPKKWEITYTNNNTILTYRDKKGFLGIIRLESLIHFMLDSYTYSVDKLSESVIAELNIPFGYKLKGEELQMLNIVNIGSDEIEKFRLRHANIDIKRNVIYKGSNSGKALDEKNLNAKFSLEDNKGNMLKYNAKANAKVL